MALVRRIIARYIDGAVPSVMGFYKRSKHLQLKGVLGTYAYCSWIIGDITILIECYNDFVVTCTRRVDVSGSLFSTST